MAEGQLDGRRRQKVLSPPERLVQTRSMNPEETENHPVLAIELSPILTLVLWSRSGLTWLILKVKNNSHQERRFHLFRKYPLGVCVET